MDLGLYRKGLLWLLVAHFVVTWSANFAHAATIAIGACHRVLMNEDVDASAAEYPLISKWNQQNMGTLDFPLKELFLPEKFKSEIEHEKGPIKEHFAFYDSTAKFRRKAKITPSQTLFRVVDEHKGKGFELSFSLKENESPFIEIIGLFDKENPKKIFLTSLVLINPLAKKTDLIHQSQKSKGLPYPVFKFLKERLFYFLKQGGIKTIEVDGAQDYTVSVLYRRFVGLEPANNFSKEYFDLFDWFYKSAKYISPEIAYKNIDEFSRILGSAREPSKPFYEAEEMWKKVLSGVEPAPTNLSIYKYEGVTYAFALRDGESKGIYFVHPQDPNYVFHWYNTTEQLHLKMDIPD